CVCGPWSVAVRDTGQRTPDHGQRGGGAGMSRGTWLAVSPVGLLAVAGARGQSGPDLPPPPGAAPRPRPDLVPPPPIIRRPAVPEAAPAAKPQPAALPPTLYYSQGAAPAKTAGLRQPPDANTGA